MQMQVPSVGHYLLEIEDAVLRVIPTLRLTPALDFNSRCPCFNSSHAGLRHPIVQKYLICLRHARPPPSLGITLDMVESSVTGEKTLNSEAMKLKQRTVPLSLLLIIAISSQAVRDKGTVLCFSFMAFEFKVFSPE